MPRCAKLFVAYCHEDSHFREELENHLAPMRRSGACEIWSDRRIGPGDDWQRAIDEAIREADVIVALLTPRFMGSDYCCEVEMDLARARHREGEAVVVPVITSPYDRTHCPFKDIQHVPRRQPVSTHEHRDEAWSEVVRFIASALDKTSGSSISDSQSPLEDAYRRLELARLEGVDPSPILEEIAALKRALRDGPTLTRNDILGERYRLGKQVGVGAFATVWRAYDRKCDEIVALKLLHGQWSTDKTKVERFRSGALSMKSLRHPCIVNVLGEPDSEGGYQYFAMEFLERAT